MQAICLLTDLKFNPQGIVLFRELPNRKTAVSVHIRPNSLLKQGLHAIHIHESGDLTHGFTSLCAHYNPFGKNHGGPDSSERHLGDMGNLTAEKDGSVDVDFIFDYMPLKGEHSIMGRSVVIHSGADDLGMGVGKDREESLKTGNAGSRVLSGIIGYRRTCE